MISFLLGPEEFLREERLAALCAELPDVECEAGLTQLAGTGLTPDLLAAQAQALPFFTSRRIVVVRGLWPRPARREGSQTDRTDWDGFAVALEGVPETNSVIFIENELVPDSQPLLKRRRPGWRIERFITPRPQELAGWIRERAGAKGARIRSDAADLLADSVAGNLRLLDLELEKLAIYAGDRPIERADVETLVLAAGTANIFQLADALLAGQRKRAIHLLRQLLAAETDPHQILAILSSQLRVAVHLRRDRNAPRRLEEFRAALGLSPRYQLDRVLSKSAGLTPDALERAYSELLAIDWAAKTGRGELTTALDLFVLAGPLADRRPQTVDRR